MPVTDPFSALAAGIEARLRAVPQFPAARWAFAIVPAPMSVPEFNRLLGLTPCFALAFKSFVAGGQARQLAGRAELALTVLVKNQQSRDARFLGDAAGPGLFPAAALAASLLHGCTVRGLASLAVVRLDQVYAEGVADQHLAMAQIDLVATDLLFGDLAGAAAAAADFTGLATTWTAPDHPAPGPLTDTITPPQP